MPDGLHLSDEDLYSAPISVRAYLAGLETYLERLLSFGAIDEDTARNWFQSAMEALEYKTYEGYETGVAADTRIINLGEMPEAAKAPTIAGVVPPLPVTTNARQLPLFKQVIAPSVYIKDAERRAISYGYAPEEAKWNALVVKAKQDAEAYQLSYVNEWLDWNELVATREKDYTKVEKMRAAKMEVLEWLGTQEQKRVDVEAAERRELERKESWARETALRERPGEYEPRIPTGEVAVREFLEEERPAAMQEFVRGKLPSVLERFQRERGRARQAWWRELQRPTYEKTLQEAEYEVKRLGEVVAIGAERGVKPDYTRTRFEQTPSEWRITQAPQQLRAAQTELARLQALSPEQISRRDERPAEEDPLAKYLAQYPWTAEFYKLSPAQRGFRPSLYKPSARWFV